MTIIYFMFKTNLKMFTNFLIAYKTYLLVYEYVFKNDMNAEREFQWCVFKSNKLGTTRLVF